MTNDPEPRLSVYEYEEALEQADAIGAATPEEIADIEHHARERTEELFTEYGLEYDSDHGTAVTRQLLGSVIDRHRRTGDAEAGRLASELSTEGAHAAVMVAIGMETTVADEPSPEFFELYDRTVEGERP